MNIYPKFLAMSKEEKDKQGVLMMEASGPFCRAMNDFISSRWVAGQ